MPEHSPEPLPKRALIVVHVLFAVPLLLLLWAFSAPGFGFAAFMLGGTMLAGLACWWLKLAVDHRGWWRAIVPAAVVLAGVFAVAGGPRESRWEASADDFAAYVAALPAPVAGEVPDWDGFTDDVEIGAYTLSIGRAVSGGYLFYDSGGALFDDAGFLYAPHGPEAALEGPDFEGPSYRALGDGWYSFTASW